MTEHPACLKTGSFACDFFAVFGVVARFWVRLGGSTRLLDANIRENSPMPEMVSPGAWEQ